MSLVHEGHRVRIRPVEPRDLETMNAWRRDAEALGPYQSPLLRSVERDRKTWAEDQWITPAYSMFAIETVAEGRLVGKVGFSKDSPVHDSMVRTISLVGDPRDRGHGYATEARCLLINYLFLSTRLERIYSETDEKNQAARRSLEKCGMRFEGVLRHLVYDLGRWMDMAVYAILREDWGRSALYARFRDPFAAPPE